MPVSPLCAATLRAPTFHHNGDRGHDSGHFEEGKRNGSWGTPPTQLVIDRAALRHNIHAEVERLDEGCERHGR